MEALSVMVTVPIKLIGPNLDRHRLTPNLISETEGKMLLSLLSEWFTLKHVFGKWKGEKKILGKKKI